MKGKKILALLLAATMACSLAACGGKGSDEGKGNNEGKENNQVQAEDLKKDEEQYLNVSLGAEPTTLDISVRSDTYSSELIMSCMESLIRVEQRDGEYTIVPGDAESWECNDDQTVWTFHLGADRKWNDGEPVTAEQYVYSLVRSADPETGCPNTYFLDPILNYTAISEGNMDPSELGVKAVDSQTLEITLKAPMPSFLESTDASVFYPQRQDIVEKYGDQYGSEADKMIYNGPFVVSEWVHNSSVKITKNDQYWDKDNIYLDYVNYQILTDVTTVVNAYDSGQIDMLTVSSAEDVMKYEADPSSVYTTSSGGTITFYFYNTEDKVFKNEKIRKAFTLAMDQEDMNEMAFSGLRDPLYGWIAPALSVEEKSMREVAGDVITEQKEELKAEGKTPQDVLVEGMEELGLGSDPAKLDVTFSLAGTDQWYRTLGEYIQQVYKEELGINLKIDFSDWGIFSDNLTTGNYQIGFMGWGAYYNDPYDMLSIHISDFNMLSTNWANKEYDKLAREGVIETDPEKRMEKYVAAERILMDNYVTCPIATSVTHQFSKSYVHDEYAEYGQDNLYFIHPGWKHTFTSGR